MFDNCKNTKAQGDIGEARAIYEYTKLGYTVCKPLSEGNKYDLIVDKDGTLYRVQVKTTNEITPSGTYKASLRTTGGNQSFHTVKHREDGDYDMIFILTGSGDAWEIPVEGLSCRSNITLGKKYNKYKI